MAKVFTQRELEAKKVTELHKLAKEYGIPNAKNTKKADLIEAILEANGIELMDESLAEDEEDVTLEDAIEDATKEHDKGGGILLRAKDVAAMLGVTPAYFRSWLRSKGGYNDKKYTRYTFVAGSAEFNRLIETFWADRARNNAEDDENGDS